jgi:hypothetical protein
LQTIYHYDIGNNGIDARKIGMFLKPNEYIAMTDAAGYVSTDAWSGIR